MKQPRGALVLFALILLPFVWLAWVAMDHTAARRDRSVPTLRIEDVTCRRLGDHFWTRGVVRNAGEDAVRSPEIRLIWTGSEGEVVDEGRAYLFGGELLDARESATFVGYTLDTAALGCRANMVGFDGQ